MEASCLAETQVSYAQHAQEFASAPIPLHPTSLPESCMNTLFLRVQVLIIPRYFRQCSQHCFVLASPLLQLLRIANHHCTYVVSSNATSESYLLKYDG